MKVKLNKIARIRSGAYIKPEQSGDYLYLQIKHFIDGTLDRENLFLDIKKENVSESHVLTPREVIFAAKGDYNFAFVYTEDLPPAVASTSFFVLTLKNENVLPEYLAWFINRPDSIGKMTALNNGKMMISISKQILGDLEIDIPTIEIQRKIVAIASLRKKENKIRTKIEMLRDKMIEQQLINAISDK
ncbi:MAG: restriction endonuclease subunit S [Brumimicrobium sp.]|nr:restriction endonuclease subunit S [Brumimicrobium sp.]MCO5268949.1 restriction endonuclease subunit S [Brumimicrobium sp.]